MTIAVDLVPRDVKQKIKQIRVKYHCNMEWTILYCFSALAKLLNSRKQNLSDISRREMLRKVKSAISVSAKRFSGYGQHVSLPLVFRIIIEFRIFRLILIKNIMGSMIFRSYLNIGLD